MMLRTMMMNWAGNARIVQMRTDRGKVNKKPESCVMRRLANAYLCPDTCFYLRLFKAADIITKAFFKQKKQFMAKGMIFHNAAFVQCYNPTCCLIIETINQLLTLLRQQCCPLLGSMQHQTFLLLIGSNLNPSMVDLCYQQSISHVLNLFNYNMLLLAICN